MNNTFKILYHLYLNKNMYIDVIIPYIFDTQIRTILPGYQYISYSFIINKNCYITFLNNIHIKAFINHLYQLKIPYYLDYNKD